MQNGNHIVPELLQAQLGALNPAAKDSASSGGGAEFQKTLFEKLSPKKRPEPAGRQEVEPRRKSIIVRDRESRAPANHTAARRDGPDTGASRRSRNVREDTARERVGMFEQVKRDRYGQDKINDLELAGAQNIPDGMMPAAQPLTGEQMDGSMWPQQTPATDFPSMMLETGQMPGLPGDTMIPLQGAGGLATPLLQQPGLDRGVIQKEALAKYVDNLDSKYGVEKQDLADAFGKLSAAQKQMPPELTARMVVANLGLESEDAAGVMKEYRKLLQALKPNKAAGQKAGGNALGATGMLLAQAAASASGGASSGSTSQDNSMFSMGKQMLFQGQKQGAESGGERVSGDKIIDSLISQQFHRDAASKMASAIGGQSMTATMADSLIADAGQVETVEMKGVVSKTFQSATMLVNNGGGEMKLQLNPENLGKIDIKVSVEGNQVTMEMVTQRPDVRKALEKGLEELRSGITGHNMVLGKVQISVAQGQGASGDNTSFQENFAQQDGSQDAPTSEDSSEDGNYGRNQDRAEEHFSSVETTKTATKRPGNGRISIRA